jgi:peroxiredoxin
MLYFEVLGETEKALPLIKQLKKEFPETETGKKADNLLAEMMAQEETKKIERSLAIGNQFPDFNEKDIDGKPLSAANYKGKVVMLDFWATWCGPCMNEMPNVIKIYGKFHPKGFEIIGISLDSDKDRLTTVLKEEKMTWRQYFDGKGWENKLAQKYGVGSIPATFLLDREGKIIGKGLRGEELEEAVAKALGK